MGLYQGIEGLEEGNGGEGFRFAQGMLSLGGIGESLMRSCPHSPYGSHHTTTSPPLLDSLLPPRVLLLSSHL